MYMMSTVLIWAGAGSGSGEAVEALVGGALPGRNVGGFPRCSMAWRKGGRALALTIGLSDLE